MILTAEPRKWYQFLLKGKIKYDLLYSSNDVTIRFLDVVIFCSFYWVSAPSIILHEISAQTNISRFGQTNYKDCVKQKS